MRAVGLRRRPAGAGEGDRGRVRWSVWLLRSVCGGRNGSGPAPVGPRPAPPRPRQRNGNFKRCMKLTFRAGLSKLGLV